MAKNKKLGIKDLDKRGIKYPDKALKRDLMLLHIEDKIVDPPESTFERLSHKHSHKPDYIDRSDDFIDPNADPGSQA